MKSVWLPLFFPLLTFGCGDQTATSETPTAPEAAAHHEASAHHEAAAASAAYVCPMHPDVTSDKPGECSQCGMALVPNEEHDHSAHEHGEEKAPSDRAH